MIFLISEEINGLKLAKVETIVVEDGTTVETVVAPDAANVTKNDETAAIDSDMKEEAASDAIDDSPPVEFTIVHNKDKYTVSMPLLSTIGQLKDKLVDMIGVPSTNQKIMIKGLAKDDQTLESLNVSSSSKIMVVGAKLQDIAAVSLANVEEVCANDFE